MNQNQVSNGRKKTYTRQWRFTEKPSSPNGPFPDYKSTSPKLQYEISEKMKIPSKYLGKDKQKQLHDTRTAEIERLVSHLSENRNNYQTLLGPESVKSQQCLDKPGYIPDACETETVLKSIIHAGQQYRNELLKAQQKKSKVSLHTAIAKKQIESVHKERETFYAENILLKSEKALLQKQLLIVRDNADRMKRKFQIDLYQAGLEIEDSRQKIKELQEVNRELKYKTDQLTKFELSNANYEKTVQKQENELARLKTDNQVLVQKSDNLSRLYAQLFDNYTRIEVHCEGLQKEVAITKAYLSNTQSQLSQNKEENYKLQEERVKSLEEKNSIIFQKNNQITLLSKKVQQQSIYLQAREKSIAELELVVGEMHKKLVMGGEDNNKLKNQMTSLQARLNDLDKQSSQYQEHIKNLNVSCKQQEINRQKSQSILEKVCKEYGSKEIEWSNALNNELNSISNEYEAKLFQLQSIIEEKQLQISNLQFKVTQAELQCSTLKGIGQKLKDELAQYSEQIKDKVDKINIAKSENKQLQNKKQDLQRLCNDLEGQIKNLFKESEIQQQNSANLKETLKMREETIIKLETQLSKRTNQATILSELKEKQLMESKNLNQLLKNMSDNLNNQTKKSTDLKSKVMQQEEEISRRKGQIQQLQHQIDLKKAENQLLSQKLSDTQSKLQSLNRQKQMLVKTLQQKETYLKAGQQQLLQLKASLDQSYKRMQFLENELKENIDRQENLKLQREGLSKLLSNKTFQNEKLKLKMIEQEEIHQNQFVDNLTTVKLDHEKSISKLDQEKSKVESQAYEKQQKIAELKKSTEDLSNIKKNLEEETALLKQRSQEQINTIAHKQSAINELLTKVEALQKQIAVKQAEIGQLEKERNYLAVLNQEKTLFAQKLKKELLVQQEELKEKFFENYQRQQAEYKGEMEKCAKEKEMQAEQIAYLALYKIRCQEQQEQIAKLSQMLKISKLNLENQKTKNKSLILENDMIKQMMKDMQEQLKAKYEGEIMARSQKFDQQMSNLSQQTLLLRDKSKSFREELDNTSKKLTDSETVRQTLELQLQEVKNKAARELQIQKNEMDILIRNHNALAQQYEKLALYSQNEHRQKEAILSSAVAFEKSNNAIVDKTAVLLKQFQEINRLLVDLKEERQILIKKYIALVNEAFKASENLTLNKQIDSIGQHFTRVSVLHRQISKHIQSSKILVSEVEGSKVVGLSVISESIVSKSLF